MTPPPFRNLPAQLLAAGSLQTNDMSMFDHFCPQIRRSVATVWNWTAVNALHKILISGLLLHCNAGTQPIEKRLFVGRGHHASHNIH